MEYRLDAFVSILDMMWCIALWQRLL